MNSTIQQINSRNQQNRQTKIQSQLQKKNQNTQKIIPWELLF